MASLERCCNRLLWGGASDETVWRWNQLAGFHRRRWKRLLRTRSDRNTLTSTNIRCHLDMRASDGFHDNWLCCSDIRSLVIPTFTEALIVLLISALFIIGSALANYALRSAPAGTVAPFQYMQLVWCIAF